MTPAEIAALVNSERARAGLPLLGPKTLESIRRKATTPEGLALIQSHLESITSAVRLA